MEATNPYAPPEAAVGDVRARSERLQKVNPFSYKGRVGRLRYLAYLTIAYFAVIAAAAAVGFLGSLLHLPIDALLGVLVGLPYIVFLIMLTIQRSHDMNWSGWTCLLGLIPFVALIWIFKSGTQGDNDYGPQTPPNPLSIKILGLIMPVIALIGILAAIALPAYQDYTKRAKARQLQMQSQSAPAAQ